MAYKYIYAILWPYKYCYTIWPYKYCYAIWPYKYCYVIWTEIIMGIK